MHGGRRKIDVILTDYKLKFVFKNMGYSKYHVLNTFGS